MKKIKLFAKNSFSFVRSFFYDAWVIIGILIEEPVYFFYFAMTILSFAGFVYLVMNVILENL